MGSSDSIDFSLSNLYRSWYRFRRGKRSSSEVVAFQYNLESELQRLQSGLATKTYTHGDYARFVIRDSKRREIAVAPVRDRVLHRLVYDYLLPTWDKSLIFDAWSCRPNKGQHKAIIRAAAYMQRYDHGWVWRADVQKFFDSVDQAVLLRLIRRRTACPDTLWLIQAILSSYSKNSPGRGMPIGNLTSQIFANIYLNEFDRFMVHTLKPGAYLRYGDDWLCFAADQTTLLEIRQAAVRFLTGTLKLTLSKKLDIVSPTYRGVTYLGIDLWPSGKRITAATRERARQRLLASNFPSYEALIKQFSPDRTLKNFYWQALELDA
jgi:hypothetical protein